MELAYRQAIRDLERLVNGGCVPRRRRNEFRRYLEHEDERVRAYAHRIETDAAVESARQQSEQVLDELHWDELSGESLEEDTFPPQARCSPELEFEDCGDIPF